MRHESYIKTRDYVVSRIRGRLQDNPLGLEEGCIQEEFDCIEKITSNLGIDDFGKIILHCENYELPTKEQFSSIKREIETFFNIKMKNGIIVQGDEQRLRDNSWWTKARQNSSNYYWDRYKEYISGQLPPDVVRTLDDDSNVIMNNLGNPTDNNFKRYGMTVGHVQSGKTANYSSVICKAADAGYKFIVVIAGGINNLRDQTQVRINEAFIGEDKGKQVGAGIGNAKKSKLPISLTTSEKDFNKQDADRNSQGINFDNTNSPIVLVIKKNTRTLTNVIDWLENISRNTIQHPMLLIDDESDYGSVNTKDEDDPTAINKKIRLLLKLFSKYNYLAYTATPYANIFIDHQASNDFAGQDLFPKDFIYTIDAPSNYFGAQEIFINNPGRYLLPVNDHVSVIPTKHNKELIVSEAPQSMLEAIRLFIINVAIRSLRGDGKKHNSMLVHTSRLTNIHEQVSVIIYEYLEISKKVFINKGKLKYSDKDLVINEYLNSFDKYYGSVEFKWKDVKYSICDTINSLEVKEVHQRVKPEKALEYSKESPSNVIAVGGASLSRGFTLEGLSVSYFLRNTIYYDTLMQMGRWFGYREGYQDLCKIFMPAEIIGSFIHIINATLELFDSFRDMSEAKRTPNDFGLAVIQDPSSILQVTARNKLRHTGDILINMNLSGQLKETGWLLNDINARKHNLELITEIVQKLPSSKTEKISNSILWRDIESDVILSFISNFKVLSYEKSLGSLVRMPKDFIVQFLKDNQSLWDVVLYSGKSTKTISFNDDIAVGLQERKIIDRGDFWEVNHRQVSSGASESIVLTHGQRKELKTNRKKAREKREKPLLMLHVLDAEFTDGTVADRKLAAFGVSFHGSKLDNSVVKAKLNTVGINALIDEDILDEE